MRYYIKQALLSDIFIVLFSAFIIYQTLYIDKTNSIGVLVSQSILLVSAVIALSVVRIHILNPKNIGITTKYASNIGLKNFSIRRCILHLIKITFYVCLLPSIILYIFSKILKNSYHINISYKNIFYLLLETILVVMFAHLMEFLIYNRYPSQKNPVYKLIGWGLGPDLPVMIPILLLLISITVSLTSTLSIVLFNIIVFAILNAILILGFKKDIT